MRRWLLAWMGATLGAGAAWAADIPTAPPEAPGLSALAEARTAVAQRHWPAAEAAARRALAANPRLADAHNLLGYSLRWQGRPQEALAAYGRVFEIDPQHLGAHEYIGQLYVQLGQRAQAQAHLDTLRRLCARCEETRDLAAAVAAAPVASAASATP